MPSLKQQQQREEAVNASVWPADDEEQIDLTLEDFGTNQAGHTLEVGPPNSSICLLTQQGYFKSSSMPPKKAPLLDGSACIH